MKRNLTVIALLATGIAGGLITLISVATAAQSTLPVRAHVAELAGDSAGPPTPTPTPRPTAVPTATPTNPPATSPSPEPAQGIGIRHYSSYVDSIGGLWIVGEVYNGLPADAEFVEITANFYSAGGVLLDTET